MLPRIPPRPDFERFLNTLRLRQAYRRPPLFDFHLAQCHKQQALGRPVTNGADEVEVQRLLGYDFVQATFSSPMQELHQAHRRQSQEAGGAQTQSAVRLISSLEQFRAQSWSWQPMAKGDLSCMAPTYRRLEEMMTALPKNMRILIHTADIFTFAWILIGFDEFCLATYEQPALISEVMQSIADAQLNCLAEAIRIGGDKVGVVMYSDDIAYTEGLLLGPDFFRHALFPHIARLVEMGNSRKLPLIYHSDGRLYPVFDDLAALGVNGIQPLEPKSMDPLEIKTRWPGKFCLLGNIDLDLMSRGTPDQVEAQVRQKIDRLNVGGGYMPGVSNTVPHYVNYENYLRMIETVYSYEP